MTYLTSAAMTCGSMRAVFLPTSFPFSTKIKTPPRGFFLPNKIKTLHPSFSIDFKNYPKKSMFYFDPGLDFGTTQSVFYPYDSILLLFFLKGLLRLRGTLYTFRFGCHSALLVCFHSCLIFWSSTCLSCAAHIPVISLPREREREREKEREKEKGGRRGEETG